MHTCECTRARAAACTPIHSASKMGRWRGTEGERGMWSQQQSPLLDRCPLFPAGNPCGWKSSQLGQSSSSSSTFLPKPRWELRVPALGCGGFSSMWARQTLQHAGSVCWGPQSWGGHAQRSRLLLEVDVRLYLLEEQCWNNMWLVCRAHHTQIQTKGTKIWVCKGKISKIRSGPKKGSLYMLNAAPLCIPVLWCKRYHIQPQPRDKVHSVLPGLWWDYQPQDL